MYFYTIHEVEFKFGLMDKTNFNIESYNAQKKHLEKMIATDCEFSLKRLEKKDTIDYWRHERMYELLRPFINPLEKWLTIGDGIGTDANWLIEQGTSALASDLTDDILKESFKRKFITEYKQENAEHLSFSDGSFSYVLCKESFHHFPRPYIALYEMIRVANKAAIIIEPIDIVLKMPMIMWIKNFFDKIDVNLINKIWKNRYSFEEVGNYVYKVSEREIEKVAMGINLPAIAFKGLHDYYTTSIDLSEPLTNLKYFRLVRNKIRFRTFLSRMGIIPYQNYCSVIFKELPSGQVKQKLKSMGYKYIELPKNPYIK